MLLPGFLRALASNRRAAIVTVVAVVVAGVGTTAATVSGGSGRPATPKTVNAWQLGGAGDGLNRFVVHLASDAVSTATHSSAANPAAPTAAASAGTRAATGTGTTGTNQLDVAALAAAQAKYGSSGSLTAGPEGDPMYVVGDQSIPVGVGDVDPAPVVSAAASPATSAAAQPSPLAVLQSQPGVASAQLLHDGSTLLATRLTAAEVAALPGVTGVAASPSAALDTTAASVPNDPYFSYEWYLKNTGTAYQQTAIAGDDVDALDGWPTSTGAGTVIADIDTGMANVTDLAGALWTNPNEACGGGDTDNDGYAGDCHGWNFYASNADVTNGGDNQHGTLVAGVIAAAANNGVGVAGEAPAAKVMPLVVGGGETVDINLAITAIYYAVNHGATVINCSFGGSMDSTTLASFKQAIDFAGAHGVLVVASSGNSTQNLDTTPSYPAAIVDPYLISVGATDASDKLASFSNYGATTVDLFAPGVLMGTTGQNDDYMVASGTSFSAPLVAAAIAMMASVDPTATPAQLRARLLSTTTPVAGLTGKGVDAGVLDVGAALGAGPGVLQYHFSNLAGTATGAPTTSTLAISGTAPAGGYTLKLRLAAHYGGATYAVSGVPVTVDSTSGTTDDSGSVTVPLTGSFTSGITVHPSVTLPNGQYAWVSQVSDNGTPVGRPAVAVFTVGSPATVSPSASSSASGGGSTASASASASPSATVSPSASRSASSSASVTPSVSSSASSSAPHSSSSASSSASSTPSSSASATATPTPSLSATPTPSPSSTSSTRASSTPSANSTARPSASSTPSASATPSTSPARPSTAPSSAGGGGIGGTPAPSGGGSGSQTYPGTDVYQITRLAPSTVSTTGGTLVTISGRRLPTNISVLVAGTPVSIFAGSASSAAVSFFAPPAVAGSYDVAVYDTVTNIGSTLPRALTYVSSAQSTSSASPSATQPSSSATSSRSPAPSSSPHPSASSTPTASVILAPSPTVTSSGSSGTGSASWTPTIARGPGGLRLVGGDPTLAGLNSLWGSASCSSTGCDAVPM